jgi:hypothetical protein
MRYSIWQTYSGEGSVISLAPAVGLAGNGLTKKGPIEVRIIDPGQLYLRTDQGYSALLDGRSAKCSCYKQR